MNSKELEIVKWIDKHESEVLRIATDLIRIRTIGKRPDSNTRYAELNSYLVAEFEKVGIKHHIYRKGSDGGPNFVATLCGTGGGKTLAIGGHTDVVPADESDWITEDGYEAKVIDGKLYGRGSADMKGGLAACLVAIRSLVENKISLKGDVVFVGSVDEEVEGSNGMKFLVESGAVKADYFINAEQTGIEIMTAYKGNCWIEVKVSGVAAHGSTPHLGVNAIEKAAKIIETIGRIGLTWETDPILGPSTINIGLIKGGTAKNVVPDECVFSLDVRLITGMTAESVLAEVQNLLKRMMRNDPRLKATAAFSANNTAPVIIQETEPLVQALLQRGEELTGIKPKMSSFISSGDMWHLLKNDVPALLCGPGLLANIHKSNEHALVSELMLATKLYALTAVSLCK